jgi:serine-type D-Ala-D-Ala carboxypeptidase/endopeptidase (penicillin-binding protein 4)
VQQDTPCRLHFPSKEGGFRLSPPLRKLMRLNKQIKYWFYRSISLLIALLIVGHSLTFDRAASALNPPRPSQVEETRIASGSGICPNTLNTFLDPIVNDPTFTGGQWGVLVQSLVSGQILYQHNANASLIPASNMKLLTTAAAVQNVQKLPEIDLSDWLTSISLANRDSNNQQADRLLDRVGGVDAIRNALYPLGVSPTTYQQVDGSGLSRSNRAEAATFVNLLKGISKTPENKIFYDSLSISGVNGTLRNRLKDSLVYGKVHGKTGTLTGVRGLSGYLENANYGPIVFSIIVNQSGQSGKVMVDAIDHIVLDLAYVKKC